MRVGTPGFCGPRLTEAREARGLNQTALAELTDIKVQSISAYEQGKQSPSPEALTSLSERLNVPERYFLRAAPIHSNARIQNRSLSSATKLARTRAERKLGWLKDIVAYVREYVDLPTLNLPSFNLPPDPERISMRQIESIADECRVFWGLGFGPIRDVVGLMENSGVIVSRFPIGADTLDALSQWDADVPFVILGSDKGSASRSRFDAAHELGHLVLHRHLEDRQIKNLTMHKMLENQAHRFAAAFLLPERTFTQEVWAPTLDAFVSLKKHWRCSVAMMIYRCEQLRMLSEEQVKRTRINLSRRGWRTEEPLDRILEPEAPKMLRTSIELLVQEGGKHREDIVQELRMNPADIEELVGLPRGYFNGVTVLEQPVVRLRQDSEKTESTVLSFPAKPRF